jgi:lipopolysaccharide/colanic/teichoic acid biosynthesis glycosyltransferase
MLDAPRDLKTEPESTPAWPDADWVSADVKLQLPPRGSWYLTMKPSFDIFLGGMLLVAVLPFMLFAWVLVKLTSRGPGFYVQTRRGRDGKPYKIWKLRSMHHNVEAISGGAKWATQNDTRVFWLGKILRKTHLDELPQLFNVIRGEMSLVGPRPERPEVIESKGLNGKVAGYSIRSIIYPGVTGLAQVQLPADSDIVSVKHKVYYDLYYIVNQSLWLDFRICSATIMKAAGMKPEWLRRIFFLPTREEVIEQFLALIHAPMPRGSHPKMQPAL